MAVGLILALNMNEAGAAVDQCYEAVTHIYSDCGLTLIVGNQQFVSAGDAIKFCHNEEDQVVRGCWLQCAQHTFDCGLMAACIDKCFEYSTTCGFTTGFIYDVCELILNNPGTEESLTEDEARAACNQIGGETFECVTTCAYENWNDCPSMSTCLAVCAEQVPPPVDDDTTPDDDTPSEPPDQSEGEAIDHSGGSACGA